MIEISSFLKKYIHTKYLLLIFFLVLIPIALLELSLRILGYQPYNKSPLQLEYQPNVPGRPDKILGYNNTDGHFTTTIQNDIFIYHGTHKNFRRITNKHPINYSQKIAY